MQSLQVSMLPTGWTTSRLEDVTLNIIGGGTPARKRKEYFGGKKVWLTPTEVPKEKVVVLNDSKEKITELGFENSSTRLIPEGSVLLTSRASIGFVAIAGCELTTNQGFASFVCGEGISNMYVAYWLWANKRLLEQKAGGTTFKEISKAKLREFSIPVPPFNEQKRIISKIEELFTKLDAGIEYLNKARIELKRYKKSVLKAAFEGQLTYRRRDKNEEQSAQSFLDEIRSRRQSVLCEHEQDQKHLWPIPRLWVWTRLGELCDLTAGIAFKKGEYTRDGVRLLQIANVSFGEIIWNVVVYLPANYLQKYPKLALKQDDVLIALNRPIIDNQLKIGQLKEADIPSILYQRVGRFDFYDLRLRRYFFYYCQSSLFLDQLKRSLQGVDQPFVNKPKLLGLAFPLAPLEEEVRIVEELERTFSIVSDIERGVDQMLNQARHVRQAILSKAFKGQLVPQDPGDGSAKDLIEHIREQKNNPLTAFSTDTPSQAK